MTAKHFKITLKDKSYEITLDNPNADPIRVTVDGEPFDVQLEELDSPVPAQAQPEAALALAKASLGGRVIKAPMPGTINKVSVKPGDQVEQGQELCVLEAMKMNNVIRSPGAGQIAEVRVAIKQSVQHGDVLIVFAG
jgi:biotin carboxyl carrier protein